MRMLLAKVGGHHFHVARNRLWIAVGDLPAGDEHGDAFGEVHDRAHDVLDHDHGHTLLLEPRKQREDLVNLRGRKTRHGLVRDQELRFRRHRTRKLELAHVDLGEASGHRLRLVAETDLPEDMQRFVRRQASTQPMMPLGASVTNTTSSTPTISRFQAEEIVTWTTCCTEPSRTAPITGPSQLIMPPIRGMAML